MTTFRFMAGLPRTGTNLLTAILSQNPSVYLSPDSSLPDQLLAIRNTTTRSEDWTLGVMRDEHTALLRGAIAAFYADRREPVVIDKSRSWGTPYHLRLLTDLLSEEPRILCPVRPLAEVVASFIRKAHDNPGSNYIDRCMVDDDFLPYWRKPLDDARVDWLLQPGGMIDRAMLSVASAYRDDTARMFHVFTYADLVADPAKTLDGIYDFLSVERYTHDFAEIEATQVAGDAEVYGIPDLHAVRPVMAATAPPPEDVLSDYALTRCAIEDFWTGR